MKIGPFHIMDSVSEKVEYEDKVKPRHIRQVKEAKERDERIARQKRERKAKKRGML